MKKYYLYNGTQQEGPFSIKDLEAKNLRKDTPIWYEGISDWTPANQIEELSILFRTPPPYTKNQFTTSETQEPNQKIPIPKKNKLRNSILIFASIFIILFGLFKINKGNSGQYGAGIESYQEKVMTIEEIEKSQPANFLSVDGTYRKNFWGTKFKIKCTITNKATVATYKDAVIRITYYTKTETVINTKEHTIYEVFAPTSAKEIELKIDNYDNVNSIGLDVISATSL